jgi:hypothetical protein
VSWPEFYRRSAPAIRRAAVAYHHVVPSIDPLWLFLSLIPGGIGFVLFVYGKKQERWPQLAAGLAFMVYPYFTPGVTSMTVVGVLLGGALWWAVRAGW